VPELAAPPGGQGEPAGSTTRRPPLDPELAAALDEMQKAGRVTVTPGNIPMLRARSAEITPTWADLLAGLDMEHTTGHATAPDGAPVTLDVLAPSAGGAAAAAICYLHGGGMVLGSARTGIEVPLSWAAEHRAVLVSVEYRLAPEFPYPTPVEDCYAALTWVREHADEIGIDPSRILLAGQSAGGGLAAAVTLMARDRGGPHVTGQLLMGPMLDDRNETRSSHELIDEGVWDRASNITGWDALLGARRGAPDVSPYAAPSRAADLSDLPPAYIDVGSCEIFRDEDVDYAVRLWHAGGQVELHVWPGGFHAFDVLAPQARLSVISAATRTAWVSRLLAAR
jgi:acetyl esterase/lipase